MMPATWVPWPSLSVSGSSATPFTSGRKLRCRSATAGSSSVWCVPKCGCVLSMPESTTAHTIPSPIALKDRWAASALTVTIEASMSLCIRKSGQIR